MENPPNIAFIHKVAADLTGRTTVQGRTHSFRCLKEGDEVHFWYLGRGKRRYNKIDQVVIHSDHSSVQCQYFGICGGCSGQHIPYEEQFSIKTNLLAENYKDNWEIKPELIPASTPYNYRNRMDFAIFPGKSGLRESGNFRKLVDVETCLIQSKWADKEWNLIRSYIIAHPEIPLNRKSEEGFLKYVTIRYSFSTEDSMVIFTIDKALESCDGEKELEAWLLEHSTAKNIIFCYNPRPSEVSALGSFKVVKGNSSYEERILNQTLQVPFDSFFQPNPKQFEPILHEIQKWIHEWQPENLIDLFCGGGFFSILFGKYFEKIYGYEVNKASIATATEIVSSLYADKESSFESIDLFQKKFIPKFIESFESRNLDPSKTFLILDPPRNGAGSFMLDWIENSNIKYIAYVSCNPKGQYDEIMKSIGKSYTPVRVLITDPYPHTPHLESLVILEKKKVVVDFKF